MLFVFWVLATLSRVSIADVLVPHETGWHCDAHLGNCLEISPQDSLIWCFLDDSVPYASQFLHQALVACCVQAVSLPGLV